MLKILSPSYPTFFILTSKRSMSQIAFCRNLESGSQLPKKKDIFKGNMYVSPHDRAELQLNV